MRHVMVVNHATYNQGSVTGYDDIGSLAAGAIVGIIADGSSDGVLLDADGSDDFGGYKTFQFFLNRTNGGLMASPNIDIASMSYVATDGAAETVFQLFFGDEGSTASGSLAAVIGTPTAGDTHILYCSDPDMDPADVRSRFAVEYVVKATDADNDDVIDGIKNAWNNHNLAKNYATASRVGSASASTIGLKLLGSAGKRLKVVAGGDFYGVTDAQSANVAYVFPVNSPAEIIEAERQAMSELGQSDTFMKVPNMFEENSNVVAGEVYNSIVITWYNDGNDLTEKHRDKQELVIFYEDGDAVEGHDANNGLKKIMVDVLTTRT